MNAVCPGSEACGSVFCRQWPENIVPDGELVGAKFGRLPEKSLSLPIRGEVLEWLKRRAWKARIRLKRIRGSNPLLSANDRVVGWVANIRLQPFLFSGWTNLSGTVLRSKLVVWLAGENQEFARSPPVRRREGRAACGNAKSSALCRRVEPGRNVVRKHSFFVSATRQSRSNGLPR